MRIYEKLLATSLIIGATAFNSGAQDIFYDWGHTLGGPGNEIGKKISTDNDGNVLLVSEFAGTYEADPVAGVATLISAGATDIAISKFDPNGNLIWVKSLGGTLSETVTDIKSDDNGNIYITGGYSGTVDFDPGAGMVNRTSNGAIDLFLLKLDANGDFQWAYTNGSAQSEVAKGVAIDKFGAVHLLGYFRNTVDFDPSAATAELTSLGGADVFVAKLTSEGDFISVYHAAGSLDEDPTGIEIDLFNNVYVTGYFQGTTNFNVLGGTQNLTSAGGNDIFVMKINANYSFNWVRQIGGPGNDVAFSMAIDKNDDILIGGYFFGTVDFDPGVDVDSKTSIGGTDLLIVKLTNQGDYILGVAAGGVSDDQIWGIDTDDENNIFTTGFMRNTVDFDPSAATQDVTVTGGGVFADQFIWKLDVMGNYMFAEHLGGGDNDHGFSVHSVGQYFYTTGYFNGTADFDFTAGVDNKISAGDPDVSFNKHINCMPVQTTDVIVSCDPILWVDGITYTESNSIASTVLTNVYGCDSTVFLNLIVKTIDEQTVTPVASTLCDNGNVTIDLGTTQGDVHYSLIDQATMNVVDGPVLGNGTSLSLDGGTISNTTTYEVFAERAKNGALSFTGNSATPTYVSLGNEINSIFKGNNNITVEAWMNTNSTNSLQTVVGNYADLGNTMQFMLRVDESGGSNKISFWIGTGPNNANYTNVASTTVILPNTWYHVAGSYDGSVLSIYVNGVLENTLNIAATFPDIANEVRIGGGLLNNSEFFSGDITGVRIWNVTRTAAEINANQDLCAAVNPSGLVAMYNMVDGIGSGTLSDESTHGNNGTLMNMNTTTSWNYANMPVNNCSVCPLTLAETPTVEVNASSTGVDVQAHCDEFTWIDGVTYAASNNTATTVLTNAVGCDSTVTLDLTITASPVAGATNNGDGTLSATGSGSIQWINCATGNAIVGETNATFSPANDGDYAVVVSAGDCSDTSECVNYSTVGLSLLDANNFSVYPNPTNGKINLSSKALMSTIVVKDAAGRIIQEKAVATNNEAVDLTDVQSGIYFVTIGAVDNTQATIRVIKN